VVDVTGTLLLNASYEPLCVIPLFRAVVLVLDERADIVEAGDGEVRSPSVSLPIPSVIRLRYFVRVPYRRGHPVSRRGVLSRDHHRCQYCDKRADTIDHVLPRSRGGGHTWENLVAACRRCNHRKDDRTPEEAGMRLARQPVAPTGHRALVVIVGELDEAWGPYLDAAPAMSTA
jgi:5-methylcytosine-specific restriction endonuclease McrA